MTDAGRQHSGPGRQSWWAAWRFGTTDAGGQLGGPGRQSWRAVWRSGMTDAGGQRGSLGRHAGVQHGGGQRDSPR